jgi:single-strand DNA-binding protein
MLNKTIIEGRLTADPELKQTPSGISVCRFSVAWNGQKEKVDFFDVTAWRNTAEFICRNFQKGDGIVIDGHLETRTYDAQIPNSGKTYKRTVWEIVCDEVHFSIGKKETKQEAPPQFSVPASDQFEEIANDEKLPF